MSRRSIQRALWRSVYKGIENHQSGLLPEWFGWLLIVVMFVVLLNLFLS